MFTIKKNLLCVTLFSLSFIPLMTIVSCSQKSEQKEKEKTKAELENLRSVEKPQIEIQDVSVSELNGEIINDHQVLLGNPILELDGQEVKSQIVNIYSNSNNIIEDSNSMLRFTREGCVIGRMDCFNKKTLIIPEFIEYDCEKIEIKTILNNAFNGFNEECFPKLTSVVIPDSVKFIGNCAFAHNEIKNLIIGDSVRTIEDGAFTNNKLTCLVLPDSLREIGINSFAYNKLFCLSIPDSVTWIDKNAFFCNEISCLKIGNSVQTIKESAFENNRIRFLEIPDSVKWVGKYAFSRNKIQQLKLSKSLQQINDYSFSNNKITSLTIPNLVERIGKFAFAQNQLMDLEINHCIQYIYEKAFLDHKLSKTLVDKYKAMLQTDPTAFESNNLSIIDTDVQISK